MSCTAALQVQGKWIFECHDGHRSIKAKSKFLTVYCLYVPRSLSNVESSINTPASSLRIKWAARDIWGAQSERRRKQASGIFELRPTIFLRRFHVRRSLCNEYRMSYQIRLVLRDGISYKFCFLSSVHHGICHRLYTQKPYHTFDFINKTRAMEVCWFDTAVTNIT